MALKNWAAEIKPKWLQFGAKPYHVCPEIGIEAKSSLIIKEVISHVALSLITNRQTSTLKHYPLVEPFFYLVKTSGKCKSVAGRTLLCNGSK